MIPAPPSILPRPMTVFVDVAVQEQPGWKAPFFCVSPLVVVHLLSASWAACTRVIEGNGNNWEEVISMSRTEIRYVHTHQPVNTPSTPVPDFAAIVTVW